MLKHTFVSRDVEIWKTLYCTYVRPHLEYAVSTWNPYLKRDIVTLEKVQRRATRFPNVLRGLSYDERLARMNLTSLEIRRVRGDLIQLFKVIKEIDSIAWHSLPTWSEALYGRRKQLRREIISACQQRHNFFLNRIAAVWNSLPDNAVNEATTGGFKRELDKYLLRWPLQRDA